MLLRPPEPGRTAPSPTWSIQSLPTMMLCTVEVTFLQT